MATEGTIVDLNTLNAKQLAKEFKAVGKGVKSKDPIVKTEALGKLSNVRYYTEGGVFLSLVEQMVPKKKTLDNSKSTLDILLTFLGPPIYVKNTRSSDHVRSALRVVYDVLGGHLDTLKIMTDMCIYKEEVKIPKVKKGQPIIIPPEGDGPIYIRRQSLKALCSIAASMSAPNTVDTELCTAFASIPTFTETICTVLMQFLKPRFLSRHDHDKESMMSEAIWALIVLVFILRNNRNASLPVILSSNVLPTLKIFSTDPTLSLFCLEIFEIVSYHADDLTGLLEEDVLLAMASVVAKSADTLGHMGEAGDATKPAAGKAAPPPPKGKKGSTADLSAVEQKVEEKPLTANPDRMCLACVKIAANTLIAVCQRHGIAMTIAVVEALAPSFTKIMLNKATWELAQAAADEPFDVDLTTVYEKISVWYGAVGLVNTDVRRAAVDTGALPLLITTLQNSIAIFGMKPLGGTAGTAVEGGGKAAPPAKGKPAAVAPVVLLSPEEELIRTPKMQTLRRVTEQSLLRLLTVASFGGGEEQLDIRGQRWHSARTKYAVDQELFGIVDEQSSNHPSHATDRPGGLVPFNDGVDGGSGGGNANGDTSNDQSPPIRTALVFPTAQLLTMISNDVDADLGTRAFRLLAAILGGVSEPAKFVPILNLDTVPAMATVSAAVQSRLLTMYDVYEALTKAREAEIEAARQQQLLSEAAGEGEEGNIASNSNEDNEGAVGGIAGGNDASLTSSLAPSNVTAPPAVVDQNVLLPDTGESLVLSLNVLENLLPLSAVHINTFATKERLSAIAALLYRCGPTGNTPSLATSSPPPTATQEYSIPLYDPRSYDWYPTSEASSSLLGVDHVYLRPILFDILTVTAAADETYRVFEDGTSSMAAEPVLGAPPPVFTTPCKDASLMACRLCADACVSTLLVETMYDVFVSQQGPRTGTRTFVATCANQVAPTLHRIVLDAALGSLLAMTRCGATGLCGILESIAELGFLKDSSGSVNVLSGNPQNALFSSMRGLKEHLMNVPLEWLTTVSVDAEASEKEKDMASWKTAQAAVASNAFVWTRSQFFDQLFNGDEFIATPATILTSMQSWPYITVCSALLGVLSSIHATRTTASLTIETITKLCKYPLVSEVNQPVVVDSFAAYFVSLGGSLALCGALGRFGTLRERDATEPFLIAHQQGTKFLHYLLTRGRVRGEYWLSKVPVEVVTDTKGKKGDKKPAANKANAADKKKGGNNPLASSAMVEEVEWNAEPDQAISPDPNHGPSQRMWRSLLEVQGDEQHTHVSGATALITAALSNLPSALMDLVGEGASINTPDHTGTTPLMYALLFNDEASVLALVNAQANMDALDAHQGPTIKYACLTMNNPDIDRVFTGPVRVTQTPNHNDNDQPTITVLGSCELLSILLDHNVDVGVCDGNGNNNVGTGNTPILCTLGLASLPVKLGGYNILLKNDSYQSRRPRETTLSNVLALIDKGANVNACNVNGVVPLHIAAARGHGALIEVLKIAQAIASPVDKWGYTPLHYCAAACPADTIEPAASTFDTLMAYSINRPLQQMRFEDDRTGHTKDEKYTYDVSNRINTVLEDALRVSSIRAVRLEEQELMQVMSFDGMNVFHLCMTAHVLQLDAFCELPHSLFSGRKEKRMELVLHLLHKCNTMDPNCRIVVDKNEIGRVLRPVSIQSPLTQSLLSKIDTKGLNIFHCASLLFQGKTPQRELTAAEKRSKRAKSYPSLELNLLDVIFSSVLPENANKGSVNKNTTNQESVSSPSVVSINQLCHRHVPHQGLQNLTSWTPLHGAIAMDNYDLVRGLLDDNQASITVAPYAHFLTDTLATSSVCEHIVAACAMVYSSNPSLLGLPLNEPYAARPLHLAVRGRHFSAVNALARCPKVDLNARDEISGMTVLHEICLRGDEEMLRMFMDVSDRLDLLVDRMTVPTATNNNNNNYNDSNPLPKSCVEAVLDSRNASMLRILLSMRRNDVLERVLTVRENTDEVGLINSHSLLMQLEVENMNLAKAMGFAVPPVPTNGMNEINQEELEKMNKGLPEHLQQMTLGATGETIPKDTKENMEEFDSEKQEQIQVQLESEASEHELEETVPTIQFTLDIPDGLNTEELLVRSDLILKMLLPVINDAGLGDHAHPCYANGTTYREYCMNAHASIVAMAFMDGVVSAAASPQKIRFEEPYAE